MDGEQVIWALNMEFYEVSEKKILQMDDIEMFTYLTKEMYLDCLTKKPLKEFLVLN